jgi:hypothetical protein
MSKLIIFIPWSIQPSQPQGFILLLHFSYLLVIRIYDYILNFRLLVECEYPCYIENFMKEEISMAHCSISVVSIWYVVGAQNILSQ